VTIVGSLAATAGTISGVNAANTVRVSATANASGQLPSLLVPRGMLSAVTELPMNDHALSAINTSSCSVTQIDAPAMTTVTGTTQDPSNVAIGGIRVDAEPTGLLALAGVPPTQESSDVTGAFSLRIAGGGRYNVRFSDPQQRIAPLVASDVAAGGVPTNAVLAQALAISGSVRITTTSLAVGGASVQVLCATCGGLDQARPIAETASSFSGGYAIAVPDPGTM
jgi:hypothetical protein